MRHTRACARRAEAVARDVERVRQAGPRLTPSEVRQAAANAKQRDVDERKARAALARLQRARAAGDQSRQARHAAQDTARARARLHVLGAQPACVAAGRRRVRRFVLTAPAHPGGAWAPAPDPVDAHGARADTHVPPVQERAAWPTRLRLGGAGLRGSTTGARSDVGGTPPRGSAAAPAAAADGDSVAPAGGGKRKLADGRVGEPNKRKDDGSTKAASSSAGAGGSEGAGGHADGRGKRARDDEGGRGGERGGKSKMTREAAGCRPGPA